MRYVLDDREELDHELLLEYSGSCLPNQRVQRIRAKRVSLTPVLYEEAKT
jgi:hypothetical protein